MKSRKSGLTKMVSLGACLLVSQAHAITISNAPIRYSTGGLENSVASALGQGQFRSSDINMLTGLFAGDAWTFLGRTNKPSKLFTDMSFLLADDTSQQSGRWGVSWDRFDFPAYTEFVLVVKSGKTWGAYLFQPASLIVYPQNISASFGTSRRDNKEKQAKLRHASIFGRSGSASVDSEDSPTVPLDSPEAQSDTTDGQTDDQASQAADTAVAPDSNSVPLPGTLALLTIGLGLGLIQLRQKR